MLHTCCDRSDSVSCGSVCVPSNAVSQQGGAAWHESAKAVNFLPSEHIHRMMPKTQRAAWRTWQCDDLSVYISTSGSYRSADMNQCTKSNDMYSKHEERVRQLAGTCATRPRPHRPKVEKKAGIHTNTCKSMVRKRTLDPLRASGRQMSHPDRRNKGTHYHWMEDVDVEAA
jgi:hypothetical protein